MDKLEGDDSAGGDADTSNGSNFSLDNEDFDFSNVGVSEDEYFTVINSLGNLDFVDDVSYSLPMNEIALAISPTFSGQIHTSLFPEGVSIRRVGEWDHDDDSDSRLCLILQTTRLMCAPEGESDFFPGDYTPEAIAALSIELSLFSEVSEVEGASDDSGTLYIDASLDEGLRSTYLFDDVMTFLGYDIQSVWIDEGAVIRIRFGFSETRVWSKDSYAEFQETKADGYQNAHLDASDAVKLPCGHEESSTIAMIRDLHDDRVVGFPTVMVDGEACHEIPVVDADSAILEVSEWPDDITPDQRDGDSFATSIARGYSCVKCDVYYPFVDAKAVSADATPSGATQEEISRVSLDGEEYVFSFTPIPARPVGYHDDFVSDDTM